MCHGSITEIERHGLTNPRAEQTMAIPIICRGMAFGSLCPEYGFGCKAVQAVRSDVAYPNSDHSIEWADRQKDARIAASPFKGTQIRKTAQKFTG